ncbi:MAG: hypothetical protein PHR35_09645, partial [Kiritimatiellae bacterium]|nr:hypothetical protein [Kiritimatiellia bacterium]
VPPDADVAPQCGSPHAGSGYALLLTMMLAITLYTSLAINTSLSSSPWRVLWNSTRDGTLVLSAAVCLAGMLWAGVSRPGWTVLWAGWALGVFLWSGWLARLLGPQLQSTAEIMAFGNCLSMATGLRLAFLGAGMAGLGAMLDGRRQGRPAQRCCAVVLTLAGMTACLLWPRAGRRSAALEATANYLDNVQRKDLAIACLQRAASSSPWAERLHLRRYGLYDALAQAAPDDASRDRLMIMALDALQEAQRAAPYDLRHLERMGMLYHNWAVRSPDEASRRLLGRESAKWFTLAAERMPSRGSTGLKAVHAVMTFESDTPRAAALLRGILAHDPENARAAELLALLNWQLGHEDSRSEAQRQRHRQIARELARRALSSPWREHDGVNAARLTKIVGQ